MHPTIDARLAAHGVITNRAHPELKSTLNRLVSAGVLTSPLPGTFLSADDQTRLGWLRAVCAWAGPRGVLHGRSAAGLWLPSLDGPVAFLAHPTVRSRRGVVVTRRVVPSEFVDERAGIRFANPGYAAVELAARDDGRAICECLRRGLADADTLNLALSALRRTDGQEARRRIVGDCMTNPWSYAELRLHRILIAGGISGWVANRPLEVAGSRVWPDVRFRRTRLVLEFDGRDVHAVRSQFLSDRERQNALGAAGYRVLRFGWEHLDQPEYVVGVVRRALRAG